MRERLIVFKDKFTLLFKQGLSSKELCQSIIIATVLTIIPIIGISTFLITTISLKKKLNLPIMIFISYLLWPIQILLIIPFIRLGEYIFSIPSTPHRADEIISSFQSSFFQTLSTLSFELVCGFVSWLLVAVPFAFISYWIALLFLKNKS